MAADAVAAEFTRFVRDQQRSQSQANADEKEVQPI
jgi:hypothetical protein